MPACAFVTMEPAPDPELADDELARAPLAALGWSLECVPWRARADWSLFDVVVLRSPWDYHHALGEFLEALEAVEASGARLENALELVRWNADKRYLADLEQRGVAIVPTLFRERLDASDLGSFFETLGCDELVLKPTVSASADDTFRVPRAELPRLAPELLDTFRARELMAQPFEPNVTAEGEFSVIVLGGEVSHAVLKTPRAGDFRVQSEHGGSVSRVELDAELHRAAHAALAAASDFGRAPLYARVDLVRGAGGEGYRLMELELIEPGLFLDLHPPAAQRLADGIARLAGAR